MVLVTYPKIWLKKQTADISPANITVEFAQIKIIRYDYFRL